MWFGRRSKEDNEGGDGRNAQTPDAAPTHPEQYPGGAYHARDTAQNLGARMAILLLSDIAKTPPTPQLIGILSATAMRAYFDGAGLPQFSSLDHPVGRLFGETFTRACLDKIFDVLGDEADQYGLN